MIESGFLRSLRGFIGREFHYLGRRCRLVDVLGDEGALVLEMHEENPPIQTDQYGHPAYRSNELLQVPIAGSDPNQLSDELMELLALLGSAGNASRG